MDHLHSLKQDISIALHEIYNADIKSADLVMDRCKKEFIGDYTLVTFAYSKLLGKSPDMIAQSLGDHLLTNQKIKSFNVIKGFLNILLLDDFWIHCFQYLRDNSIADILRYKGNPETYLIEFCSPNTNKPLHLGHIRNILLGWSMTRILQSKSYEVNTTQVINDRGIAICKSMLAWSKFGGSQTPSSTGIKGDHFVGDYYVMFENKFKEEYLQWQISDAGQQSYQQNKKVEETEVDYFVRWKNDYFNKHSILGREARELLNQWEQSDANAIVLWSQMNQWVYSGFNATYESLQVSFDSVYHESKTYLLGKEIIQDGLSKNIFSKEADGSVWVDLTNKGLDKKILLRSDGTSVYITQDLGTARQRHQIHNRDHYLYVVADEQDYHFKVLFETLKLLQEPYASGMHHLSYGMVELPTGRMKSREGTVVDADDLIAEVIAESKLVAEERGELMQLSDSDKNKIYYQIGMAALKYFMLKVQAKKRMVFDPKESVDMQGNTGPYIVNAYVRIKSIERKQINQAVAFNQIPIADQEKEILKLVSEYPAVIDAAIATYDPSGVANYTYALAREFHRFYHDHRILNAESEELIAWRLSLCKLVAQYIEHGMYCLGITMPDRM